MGCASSAFLEDEDRIVGGPALGHHIVSLTSTTYGLLTTLDQPPPQTPPPPAPPPPPPPPPSTPSSALRFLPIPRSEAEVINSWELMAGLDPTTPTQPALAPSPKPFASPGMENYSHRSIRFSDLQRKGNVLRPLDAGQRPVRYSPEMFEKRCPPGGAQAAVLYTTTLRGVRKTFEECNAVRAAVEGLGVWVRERDVSMDMGFREELRELMKGSGVQGPVVPRLFVKGRDIGGAEAVLRIHEEGGLAGLLEGLPTALRGGVCDGCGGVRFLPCFQCSGSRKVVVVVVVAAEDEEGGKGGGGKPGRGRVVRCMECNENGLVLCPICS